MTWVLTRFATGYLGFVLLAGSLGTWSANAETAESTTALQTTKVLFERACRLSSLRTAPPPAVRLPAKEPGGKEAVSLAPILAAVLPSLIDKLTTGVAKYLENRSKEFSATDTQNGHAELALRADGVLGCLIYIRGTFAPSGTPTTADQRWNDNVLQSLGLTKRPDFYLEFWLHYVDAERLYFTMTPGFLDYRTSLAKRPGDGVKDLLVTVSLSSPAPASGEKIEEKPLAAFVWALRKLPIGKQLDQTVLAGTGPGIQFLRLDRGHSPLPPPLPPPGTSGSQSPVSPLLNTLPVNIALTVAESGDGGDVLLAISQALAASKPELDPKLKELLVDLLGLDKGNKTDGK